MKVTILVTLLNDLRVVRTLDSLSKQTMLPLEIIVADGGSSPEMLSPVRALAKVRPLIRIESCPGSVGETRNLALPLARGDAIAFIDSDEAAPEGWLAALARPLDAGEADFAGGPTLPFGEPLSRAERYVNDFDDWFYREVVPRDVTALPMGNSIWKRAVFDRIGNFDASLTMGGEDYDVNLRASRAGFRGRFVPEAWVYHDQSHLSTFRKVVRRKYRYGVGATLAYLKNGALREKAGPAASTAARFRHPYEWANVVVKPAALARGWWLWRKLRRRALR